MTQHPPIMHVISLGAGVQSTTMALMAAHGEIEPMPDAAIFADTGAEPKAVYEHLDWLRSGNVLPFPVEVVQFSDLADDIRKTAAGVKPVAGRENGYLAPPFFTVNTDGSHGMLRRECTSNYKIKPIQRRIKELLGRPTDKPIRSSVPLACSWLGISADEWIRVKPSDVRWLAKRHPLIDRATQDGPPPHERWMSRQDCIEWLARHDYPIPPRSACTFCPYQSAAEWEILRANPDDWDQAVAIDRLIRDMPAQERAGLKKGGRLYVNVNRRPLEEIETGGPIDQSNLWAGECEGMCGI